MNFELLWYLRDQENCPHYNIVACEQANNIE